MLKTQFYKIFDLAETEYEFKPVKNPNNFEIVIDSWFQKLKEYEWNDVLQAFINLADKKKGMPTRGDVKDEVLRLMKLRNVEIEETKESNSINFYKYENGEDIKNCLKFFHKSDYMFVDEFGIKEHASYVKGKSGKKDGKEQLLKYIVKFGIQDAVNNFCKYNQDLIYMKDKLEQFGIMYSRGAFKLIEDYLIGLKHVSNDSIYCGEISLPKLNKIN